MFLSQAASFDPASGLVTFTIDFNHPPDFFTTDALGRRRTAFNIS